MIDIFFSCQTFNFRTNTKVIKIDWSPFNNNIYFRDGTCLLFLLNKLYLELVWCFEILKRLIRSVTWREFLDRKFYHPIFLFCVHKVDKKEKSDVYKTYTGNRDRVHTDTNTDTHVSLSLCLPVILMVRDPLY